MKTKLPILTLTASFIGVPVAVGQMTSSESAITDRQTSAVSVADQSNEGAAARFSGQELVTAAAAAVFRQPSISAKIRQKIDLFGHRLVGTGSYMQLGDGPEKHLRLDLRIQVGDRVTSLQQVSNGSELWIRQDLPEGPHGKGGSRKIDLSRVRKAIESSGNSSQLAPPACWLALGGLSKLLTGLAQNFDFSTPQAAEIRGVRVWAINGAWKVEKLLKVMPNQEQQILAGGPDYLSQLPGHLPERVTVVIGRDDLFPYRIEYHRRDGDRSRGHSADGTRPRTIVKMELFEVRLGASIDPLQFKYTPDGTNVSDHTSLFLERMGLAE